MADKAEFFDAARDLPDLLAAIPTSSDDPKQQAVEEHRLLTDFIAEVRLQADAGPFLRHESGVLSSLGGVCHARQKRMPKSPRLISRTQSG